MQAHLERVLEVLQSKLERAQTTLAKALDHHHHKHDHSGGGGGGGVRKIKYALWTKEQLEDSINDLEKWNKMFQPSWFLLTRTSNPSLDRRLLDVEHNKQHGKEEDHGSAVSTMRLLRSAINPDATTTTAAAPAPLQSIFLQDSTLVLRHRISFSSADVAYEMTVGKNVIIDTVTRSNSSIPVTALTRDVRNLGRVLSKVDPSTFHLLACCGILKGSRGHESGGPDTFELLLEVPRGLDSTSARSLRSILLGDSGTGLAEDYWLNDRIELARSIAKSVLFMHASGLVHKNIRPENIIIFPTSSTKLGMAFLVGFEDFRSAEGATAMQGDLDWTKNIYRHPNRQGLCPDDMYQMQHDIYSLGVCLLEIGLWISFVHRADGDMTEANATPSPSLEISDYLAMPVKEHRKKARLIMKVFVDIATEQLPVTMGSRYADVVVSCLSCLNVENNSFGDDKDLWDEDGLVIGVRYIEKVLPTESISWI